MHINFWTGQGCKTVSSNETHTICSFDYISTYALIQTPDVPDDLKILPIVIISITNCCVAAIILTLAVLCWKRVQVGFCECSCLISSVLSFLSHITRHLFTGLIFVTHVQTHTKSVGCHWWWCCRSKSWDDFYALPPDPTSLHSARAISTQSSVNTTTSSLLEIQMSRPPLDVSML